MTALGDNPVYSPDVFISGQNNQTPALMNTFPVTNENRDLSMVMTV